MRGISLCHLGWNYDAAVRVGGFRNPTCHRLRQYLCWTWSQRVFCHPTPLNQSTQANVACLMHHSRDDVLAIYRANNLKRGLWNEGKDHIALELEFIQVMSQRTAKALRSHKEDEADHLKFA